MKCLQVAAFREPGAQFRDRWQDALSKCPVRMHLLSAIIYVQDGLFKLVEVWRTPFLWAMPTII